MKKDKNFYHVLIMILFVVSFVSAFFLAEYSVHLGKLVASASVVLFPMTYFLITLFSERYGKEKTHTLIMYAVVSLLFVSVFATAAYFLGPDDGTGLKMVDYQLIFAAIAGFVVSQITHLEIYYYLNTNKKIDFLIAGVISVSINVVLFIGLGYLGKESFTDIMQLMLGQFVFSVLAMIVYFLCYAYLIPTVVETKEKEISNENRVLDSMSILNETPKKKAGRPKKVQSENKTTTKKKAGRPKKTEQTK